MYDYFLVVDMEILHKDERPQIITKDQAFVRDIVSAQNSSARNQSLTEVVIKPGSSVLKHYYKISEELYCILAGVGCIQIEDEKSIVSEGDAVVILPGQVHGIENTGNMWD